VQVTKDPAHDWQPDWSPDGSRLAFRSEREGGGLFIVPVLGGTERRVAPFGYRPRWSPDGSQILFYASILAGSSQPRKAYVVSLDGQAPREVFAEFDVSRAAWHPDGKRVTVRGEYRGSPAGLWTVPIAGGTPVRIDGAPSVTREMAELLASSRDFAWAPSGTALYVEGTSRGVVDLWRLDVDPQKLVFVGGPDRLTTGPGSESDVAVSRDGKRVAFTIRDFSSRIWLFPFDARTGKSGGDGRPITEGGNVGASDLTSDGKKLVYQAERDGKWELRVRSLDDDRETVLVPPDDHVSRVSPRWSRDGKHLAYRLVTYLNQEGTEWATHIVLLGAGGGGEEALTSPTSRVNDIAYDWSNDGQWILATSRRGSEREGLCLFPVSAAPRAESRMRVLFEKPPYRLWQGRFSPDERWICFNAERPEFPGLSRIYVVPASGGDWTPITDETDWADKGRWAPDGRTIYFLSNRQSGFFNVWGIRVDPRTGTPVGGAFRVTTFENPGRMILVNLGNTDISLTSNRLVVPMADVSGNIWVLEGVDR